MKIPQWNQLLFTLDIYLNVYVYFLRKEKKRTDWCTILQESWLVCWIALAILYRRHFLGGDTNGDCSCLGTILLVVLQLIEHRLRVPLGQLLMGAKTGVWWKESRGQMHFGVGSEVYQKGSCGSRGWQWRSRYHDRGLGCRVWAFVRTLRMTHVKSLVWWGGRTAQLGHKVLTYKHTWIL